MIRRIQPAAQPSHKELYALAVMTKRGSTGRQKTLSGSLNATIGYDRVTIALEAPLQPIPPQKPLRIGENRYGRHLITIDSHALPGAAQVALTSTTLYVRSPQKGDRIEPAGMTGSKKLQDLFTDARIDRYNRAYWPVIVDSHTHIVWVPGLAISRTATPHSAETQTYYVTHEVI